MRSRAVLCALALSTALVPPPGKAQQALRSPYLVNPDLAIGYVDSCTNFWMTAYDSVNGGFSANVDRAGQLLASWGTNENLVSQTRNAYGFVRGFMMTGNESSR